MSQPEQQNDDPVLTILPESKTLWDVAAPEDLAGLYARKGLPFDTADRRSAMRVPGALSVGIKPDSGHWYDIPLDMLDDYDLIPVSADDSYIIRAKLKKKK
jgi:hypothetical protein